MGEKKLLSLCDAWERGEIICCFSLCDVWEREEFKFFSLCVLCGRERNYFCLFLFVMYGRERNYDFSRFSDAWERTIIIVFLSVKGMGERSIMIFLSLCDVWEREREQLHFFSLCVLYGRWQELFFLSLCDVLERKNHELVLFV